MTVTYEVQDENGETLELFEAIDDQEAINFVKKGYEKTDDLLLLRHVPID